MRMIAMFSFPSQPQGEQPDMGDEHPCLGGDGARPTIVASASETFLRRPGTADMVRLRCRRRDQCAFPQITCAAPAAALKAQAGDFSPKHLDLRRIPATRQTHNPRKSLISFLNRH